MLDLSSLYNSEEKLKLPDAVTQISVMCRTMSSISKRILTALGNGPTRRNLFGPVDREQLQAEYQDMLQKDLEDASRRWGFNFATETPMEGGDFQWEGVAVAKVPMLYRSCMVEVQRPSTSGEGSGLTNKENIPRTPERCTTKAQHLEMTPEKEQCQTLKRKQTNITGKAKSSTHAPEIRAVNSDGSVTVPKYHSNTTASLRNLNPAQTHPPPPAPSPSPLPPALRP
ncbi:hypothetical protein JZ751_017679 [Albula glossodonta]|uniref:Cyclin-dependent kinase inhibitor domain-containing protein n=1 Tax=Albula glossodonta TaxID=121402 RepID=A0A8T2PIG1_9TELE|nr:hypothetical protein JZ751_017679 [Albula glossodonta]